MLPPSIRRINIVAACEITIRWICEDPWLSFQSCWFLTYVIRPDLDCMEYFQRPVCKHFLLSLNVCSSQNDYLYLQVMTIDKVIQLWGCRLWYQSYKSCSWKSFCKSWRCFSQNWNPVSWIQYNRWEGKTMYLGNQVRDDTNGAHHEAKHEWVSRLYIVLQTIKIYISAPSNPNNQRLLVLAQYDFCTSQWVTHWGLGLKT